MQRNKTKIFITSCEIGEGAWRNQEYKLKELYELSDKRYSLTNSPESADIILVGNAREENWGEKMLGHDLVSKYPDKCFSLSQYDHPLFLNRGIYTNNTKSIRTLGRVRTGSYALNPDKFLNPYVESHVPSDQDYVQKEYLLTFIGRRSHRVRNTIFHLKFERQDIFVEDSSAFRLWAPESEEKQERQKYYYDKLLRSKFSLCPRGSGTNSIRIFESMQLGIAPVIISDEWIFPKGPRWNEFSIVIKAKHVRNLAKIVQSYEENYEQMGRLARKAFDEYFAKGVYFNYVVDSCLDIMNTQRIPEAIYWNLNPLIVYVLKTMWKTRKKLSPIKGKLKSIR